MAKFCKVLSLRAFSALLDLVYEGLSAKGLNESSLVNLVHLNDVVMQNSPDGSSTYCSMSAVQWSYILIGSLRLLQIHLTRCLGVFADSIAFGKGDHLREPVLAFMANQFNDRVSNSLGSFAVITNLLGSCLTGSTHHASSTSKNALTDITTTISALLRLRRDLVSTTLPHLGLILRRLIMSFRRLRPHLGGKQTRLVSETLPSWISPLEPVRVEDAKAVARLLTTLTTKTVVRTYGSGASTIHAETGQKAESLARPFSKHASYVLCAYVDALGDPLCMLPAEVRKALEPGLFALCEMMGEKNRDAMMVASLDAGGKSVMKGIWREYEKQKYVGKG
jgi:hypothetical protein